MQRRQWERDLLQRQRNFVFPDTVRNEGNFYRTLVRGKGPLAGGHRFGLVVLGIPTFCGGCIGIASAIGGFLRGGDFMRAEDEFFRWLTLVVGGGVSVAACLFGALLIFRAVLRPSPSERVTPAKKPKQLGKVRIKK